MKRKAAFTLVEVLISLAVVTIMGAGIAAMVINVAKWYPTAQSKAQMADQARLLDAGIRRNFSGVGFYEVYDWFPQTRSLPAGSQSLVTALKIKTATRVKNTNKSGNMIVMAYPDWDAANSADTATRLSAAANPRIRRIAGYFVDTTDAANPVLRFFDSGDPTTRGVLVGSTSMIAWLNRFPATLPTDAGPASLSSLLPDGTLRTNFPVICRLDPLFVEQSVISSTSPGSNTDQATGTLKYQTFYPQTNQVLINFSLRYGNTYDYFVQPMTLTLSFRQ